MYKVFVLTAESIAQIIVRNTTELTVFGRTKKLDTDEGYADPTVVVVDYNMKKTSALSFFNIFIIFN